jgi:cell division protein FtsQ
MKSNLIANLILSVLLLICVGGLMLWANHKNEQRNIAGMRSYVHAERGLLVTSQVVDNLLKQKFKGLDDSLKTEVNLHVLESEVLKLPHVSEALVYQGVRGDIGIEVFQRVPLLRVYDKGEMYYLDTHGVSMPVSKTFSARVPIFQGSMNEKTSEALLQIMEAVEEDEFWSASLAGIKMDEHGFHLITRDEGHDVLIGDETDLPMKFKKYRAFLTVARKQEKAKDFNKVNLIYEDQVVCSK